MSAKRDCREYKAHMKEIKASKTPTLGMFVIEINMSTSSFKNLIFYSGYGTHICTDVQVLQISRRLALGEIDLHESPFWPLALLFWNCPQGIYLNFHTVILYLV